MRRTSDNHDQRGDDININEHTDDQLAALQQHDDEYGTHYAADLVDNRARGIDYGPQFDDHEHVVTVNHDNDCTLNDIHVGPCVNIELAPDLYRAVDDFQRTTGYIGCTDDEFLAAVRAVHDAAAAVLGTTNDRSAEPADDGELWRLLAEHLDATYTVGTRTRLRNAVAARYGLCGH